MKGLRTKDLFLQNGAANFNIDAEWLPDIKHQLEGDFFIENSMTEFVQGPQTPMRGIKTIAADPTGKIPDSLGILDIKGVLLYSCPEWAEGYGYTGYDLIERRLNALLYDPTVKTILLRVQSPGGMAIGASELSEKIFQARGQKKIVTYADPYAFSAAYEIASAASSFYMIRSGMVGSIGAYTMHVDISEALKEQGVKVTFIKAGEKKVDGNAYEPLSERARKDLQTEVDHFYDVFVADVARNRNVSEDYVKENFGKAGRVMSKEALEVGMIDGIVSLDELLNTELTAIQTQNNVVRGKAFIQHNQKFLELED